MTRAWAAGLDMGGTNIRCAAVSVAGDVLLMEHGPSLASRRAADVAENIAAQLTHLGFRLVSGGTDNHLMLVDLRPRNITGKEAEQALDRAGITVNKNSIPFDTVPVFKGGGIRIGTPAVTTRGMLEEEMMDIADYIHDALRSGGDETTIAAIHDQVRRLTHRFPLPG